MERGRTHTGAAVALSLASLLTACTGTGTTPSVGASPTAFVVPRGTLPVPSPTPTELQVTIEQAYQFRTDLYGYVYWTVQNATGAVTHSIQWGDGKSDQQEGRPPSPIPPPVTPWPNGDPWVRGHDYGKSGTYQIVITSKDASGKTARGEFALVIGRGSATYRYERGAGCRVGGTGASPDNSGGSVIVGSCEAGYGKPGRPGHIEVTSAISGAIREHPVGIGYVWNDIKSGPGAYTMRANIGWKGWLAAMVGLGGSSAHAKITINVVDTNRRDLVQPYVVDEVTLRQDQVTTGALNAASPPGGEGVVFEFKIPATHTGLFWIELRLLCEVESGTVVANIACSYDNSEPDPGGYVEYVPSSDGFIFVLEKTLE